MNTVNAKIDCKKDVVTIGLDDMYHEFNFSKFRREPCDEELPSKDEIIGLVRESWIRGCPDGRTIPSAGLLDYEDKRLKTSSRVRNGLSLAWKASLAIRICRSPTIVTDFV